MTMAIVTQIAPDIFRISIYAPQIDLQFNHFLIKDEEPLLFHTGLKAMFPEVRDEVARLMDPSHLRWISFSHFESDECGSLNHWLELAPSAQPACNIVGALVSVNDFSMRPARVMEKDEVLATGKYRFRFCRTPHLPHGWDAGVVFEETNKTLLCSDLFHQWGNVEPLTEADIVGRAREALIQSEAGPFANYVPYTHQTGEILKGLANLKPNTLAAMHGSTFVGNGQQALCDLAEVMKEVLGP